MAQLCGIQKEKPGVKYRLSFHCMQITCEEGTLLYHVQTGAMILLSPEETVEENRSELIANWFLVPFEYDEKKRTDDLRRIVVKLRSSTLSTTHFTILTTTDCNARCFYCYEKGISKLTMSMETARDVARYMAKKCGDESLHLNWFGGEPLLNSSAIDTICSELRSLGIEYESRTMTNGYYLDADTCINAKNDWHLNSAVITIDGTERVYNSIKAYVNCKENAYLRVLNNIQIALDTGICITVRLNIHQGNKEDLLQLLEELNLRFSGQRGFHVYAVNLKNPNGSGYIWQEEAAWQYKAIFDKRIEEIGASPWTGPPRGIITNQCMADSDISEVIFPDGRIGKCEHFKESEIIGSIYSENRDENRILAWKARYNTDHCNECTMYPLCIRLKNCFWQEEQCTESMRMRRINLMKKQVLATYQTARDESLIENGEMR